MATRRNFITAGIAALVGLVTGKTHAASTHPRTIFTHLKTPKYAPGVEPFVFALKRPVGPEDGQVWKGEDGQLKLLVDIEATHLFEDDDRDPLWVLVNYPLDSPRNWKPYKRQGLWGLSCSNQSLEEVMAKSTCVCLDKGASHMLGYMFAYGRDVGYDFGYTEARESCERLYRYRNSRCVPKSTSLAKCFPLKRELAWEKTAKTSLAKRWGVKDK